MEIQSEAVPWKRRRPRDHYQFQIFAVYGSKDIGQCLMLVMSDCGTGAMCGMPSQDMGHSQASISLICTSYSAIYIGKARFVHNTVTQTGPICMHKV